MRNEELTYYSPAVSRDYEISPCPLRFSLSLSHVFYFFSLSLSLVFTFIHFSSPPSLLFLLHLLSFSFYLLICHLFTLFPSLCYFSLSIPLPSYHSHHLFLTFSLSHLLLLFSLFLSLFLQLIFFIFLALPSFLSSSFVFSFSIFHVFSFLLFLLSFVFAIHFSFLFQSQIFGFMFDNCENEESSEKLAVNSNYKVQLY